MSGHHHRAGKLHQANKLHKTLGGFSTKRAVTEAAHGRVERSAGPGGGGGGGSIKSLASVASSAKANRVNHAKQVKEQRRAEALVARRVGAAGGGYGPPRVVAIVGLGATANRAAAAATLLSLADDAALPVGAEAFGSPLTLTYHTFRARVTLLAPPRGGEVSQPQPAAAAAAAPATVFHYDVTHTLAGAAAADVLLVVVDMAAALAPGGPGLTGSAQGDWEAAVDSEGDLFMSCVKATGLPSVVGVIQGLEALPPSRQGDARRWAHRLFATEFGADVKVVEAGDVLRGGGAPLETAHASAGGSRRGGGGAAASAAAAGGPASLARAVADGSALHLVRAVTAVSPRQLTWRSHRPYLLVQGLAFAAPPARAGADSDAAASGAPAAAADAPSGDVGSLTVTGYLRGPPINVHQLLVLPWAGAFQIESIRRQPAAPGGAGGDPFKPPPAGKFARKAFEGGQLPAASTTGRAPAAARVYQPLDVALAGVVTLQAPLGSAAAAAEPGKARVRLVAPPAASSGGGAVRGGGAPCDDDDRGLLVLPDESYREPLESVAAPGSGGAGDDDEDGMGGAEQTWPEEDDDEEEGERAMMPSHNRAAHSRRLGGASGPGWLTPGLHADLDMVDEEDGEEEDDDDDEAGDGAEGAAAGASGRSAKAAAAAEGRERLQARARRRALRKRGVLDLDESGGGDGDDAGDDAEGDDGGGKDDAEEEDDLSVGGEDAEVDDAVAGAARAAMRGGTAGGSAPAAGATAASRSALQLAAETNAQFPDEVDTPVGVPARVRFGRYRGLKSFRSSPWDPKESLPPSYGHIFELPGFSRLQRRVLAEASLAERAVLSLEGAALAASRGAGKAARDAAKARAASGRRGGAGSGGASVSAASTAGSVMAGDADAGEEPEADDNEEEEEAAGGDADDVSMGAGAVAPSRSAASTTGASSSAPTAAGSAPAYRSLSDVLGPGWVAPGGLVSITLREVPRHVLAAACLPGVPLTATALLRHENRTSVGHFSVQRYAPYELGSEGGGRGAAHAAGGDASAGGGGGGSAPLANKIHLELHGAMPGRVTDVCPLWSTPTSAASGERSKLERFLPGGGAWSVATAFAPVTYAPMPVLYFRRIPLAASSVGGPPAVAGDVPPPMPALYRSRLGALDQRAACGVPVDAAASGAAVPAPRFRLQLVGWGAAGGVNPDRIILKRTILSGFPVKVKNRSAVIKYMFYEPADVEWFAPVEVYTKHGCTGSIRMSLGTHGLLKTRFDRIVKQHDTVCMPLYKRVFPRWGFGYSAGGLIRQSPEEAAAAEFARGPRANL